MRGPGWLCPRGRMRLPLRPAAPLCALRLPPSPPTPPPRWLPSLSSTPQPWPRATQPGSGPPCGRPRPRRSRARGAAAAGRAPRARAALRRTVRAVPRRTRRTWRPSSPCRSARPSLRQPASPSPPQTSTAHNVAPLPTTERACQLRSGLRLPRHLSTARPSCVQLPFTACPSQPLPPPGGAGGGAQQGLPLRLAAQGRGRGAQGQGRAAGQGGGRAGGGGRGLGGRHSCPARLSGTQDPGTPSPPAGP